MTARLRTYAHMCYFDERSHNHIKMLSSLSPAKGTIRGISSVFMQLGCTIELISDNSGSIDVECKPLPVKAHTENGGSNVWMLILGKPCNEWIDLINTQNNQYWFVIMIRNNIGALNVDKRDSFILCCVRIHYSSVKLELRTFLYREELAKSSPMVKSYLHCIF